VRKQLCIFDEKGHLTNVLKYTATAAGAEVEVGPNAVKVTVSEE